MGVVSRWLRGEDLDVLNPGAGSCASSDGALAGPVLGQWAGGIAQPSGRPARRSSRAHEGQNRRAHRGERTAPEEARWADANHVPQSVRWYRAGSEFTRAGASSAVIVALRGGVKEPRKARSCLAEYAAGQVLVSSGGKSAGSGSSAAGASISAGSGHSASSVYEVIDSDPNV